MISCVGPVGPGLRRVPADENRRRYFRSTSALWNRNNVAGLSMTASFATRRGRTNSVIKPSTNRSIVVRGGARRRERPLMISSCFSYRDSAITERTPPGRASLARVTNSCTASRSMSRIEEACYQRQQSAQGCPNLAPRAMISEFAPHTSARNAARAACGRRGFGASSTKSATSSASTSPGAPTTKNAARQP